MTPRTIKHAEKAVRAVISKTKALQIVKYLQDAALSQAGSLPPDECDEVRAEVRRDVRELMRLIRSVGTPAF